MEDKSASPTASILGSPLDGAKALYPGLRKRYSQGNMLEMVAEVDGGGHSTRDCKGDLPCGENEGQSVAREDGQEEGGGENVGGLHQVETPSVDAPKFPVDEHVIEEGRGKDTDILQQDSNSDGTPPAEEVHHSCADGQVLIS